MKHKVLKPNVVRGGIAIPLGANYYYMSGRKHKDGGIDIGKNPRTGLEVEDGEVMHINKDNVKVFSSVPFLNGKSPAQKVMGGENPNKVFNQQEEFKDKHNINDDGTKKNTRAKAEMGIYDDLDELAHKAEPLVSGTSLASAGISLVAPNPITPVITTISNIGGGIIDGYQAIRHGIKGNYKQAAINAGEAALSLFGAKAIKMMAKNKAISKIGKVREKAINKRYNTKQGNKRYLIRKGFTDEQATKIMLKNAANFVDNSKKFKKVANVIHEAEQNKGAKISAIGDAIMDIKDVTTEINNRRKRMGGKDKRNGLYSITVNGRTKLRMYPSTGGLIQSDKMEFGGRRKARLGITNTKSKNNILPKINIGHVEPIGITNTPMNVSKNIKNIPINYNYNSTDNTIPFRYKIKQYIEDNPQTVSDGLGLASNIIGGLITRRKNNRMLNKLKYSDAPIATKAAKLKTRININPQLDKMRESLSEYERNIDNSTSSSRVALARKQQARLANTLQTNELYGNKENTETELINKDKLNQQTVADANIREYNLWREKKAAFNNAVLEKKAENDVSLFNTINSGIQDIISRGEKRNSERQTRLAMMAANPNVNPRILKGMGIKGITDEDVAAYDKTYGKKKKSKQIK